MPEETEKSLIYDQPWYERFKEHAAFTAWEYLGTDPKTKEEQKQKFLAGEIKNPSLTFPKALAEDWEKREQALLALKQDIVNQEPNAVVAQAYRWRLNEKIATIRMMKAIKTGDLRRFSHYADFVFGRPSKEIFSYTIRRLREKINLDLSSNNPVICQAAMDLAVALPADLPEPRIISLPSEGVVAEAREITEREFTPLINLTGAEQILNANEAKEVFEQALDIVGAKGWRVVIEENKPGLAVRQVERVVRIPSQTKGVLQTLIVHEIGTHVKRRINGERSKLMLLGLGLDRYGKGEEGIATMREQAIWGKVSGFSGLDDHLAVSLGMGLDGKPRDFRSLFEIMEKYYLYKELVSGKDLVNAKKEAQDQAFSRCLWAFRGTNYSTPGVCYAGDIGYREGNIGVWEVIRTNPDEMLRFSIGKYDPANPRHTWILERLGITDKDLRDLEKSEEA